MEDGRGARGLSQQRLDQAPDVPEGRPAPDPTPVPPPLEPAVDSDERIRLRRAVWETERRRRETAIARAPEAPR